MLTALLRAWRAHARQADALALARRLGPHLARDIGLDAEYSPPVLPTLRPF